MNLGGDVNATGPAAEDRAPPHDVHTGWSPTDVRGIKYGDPSHSRTQTKMVEQI